ncbi:hypothetical protein DL767_002397 [Monosporascus sp. MG133]|nr:hypothetical protein DL767_002397 [Monosporascus sp. MG133]
MSQQQLTVIAPEAEKGPDIELGKLLKVKVGHIKLIEIEDYIVEAFRKYPFERINTHHIAAHDALLRAIIRQYDQALWLFREPVRDIEKGREEFAKRIKTLTNQELDQGRGIMSNYVNMHELSRHAIHMSETLQVAGKTVQGMVLTTGSSIPATYEILNGLQFSAGFLNNLKLRADAFIDRLDNEIRLAYNVVDVHQLKHAQGLLEQIQHLLEQNQHLLEQNRKLLDQTRNEGKDMATTVTALSLIFLPATVAAVSYGIANSVNVIA